MMAYSVLFAKSSVKLFVKPILKILLKFRVMLTTVSPLRYPGSKRRFAKYIDALININGINPLLFVELFAGGASVSLYLLGQNNVQNVGLVELDPLVAAFWQVVFSVEPANPEDLNWLIDQIEKVDVSLNKWNELRNSNPDTVREKAFKCLFLNRTSFSGILAKSAGPIGGQRQQSAHKIDCRFPKEKIISRIRSAANLSDRVQFVECKDWLDGYRNIIATHSNLVDSNELLFYLDPPFFKKANRLYNHYFTRTDHELLRDIVTNIQARWILSYDRCDEILQLYEDLEPTHLESIYTGAQTAGNRPVRELVYTNVMQLPTNNRLWQPNNDQRNGNN